jgi:uncharacterized membrane protein
MGASIGGLAKLWHACPNRHAERFPWHAAFTAVRFFFFNYLLYQRLYIVKSTCVYMRIWLLRDCNELPTK